MMQTIQEQLEQPKIIRQFKAFALNEQVTNM